MAEPLLDAEMMQRLEQLTLVSRKLSTGRLKGERRSRRHGSSTDFADYRNYAPGDDLRFLDWKIYGRLERLFLKLFQEEEDLRVSILLDVSRSMAFGEPEKLLYAKRVAAAVGYLCLARMDTLGVYTFGNDVARVFGPKRGRPNAPALFEALSAVEPEPGTRLYGSFRTFSQTARRGLVFVISDFYDFEGYAEAFRQLFAADFEVAAIHVLSPGELRPRYQGDIRLVDDEYDYSADVSMGRNVLDLYDRALNAFCGGIRQYVVSRGGYYLFASTESPFEKLVLDALRRQGVIR